MAAVQSILVVDDDPLVLNLFGRSLREEGYEVHLAGDGTEAYQVLDRQRFPLVITDLVMDPVDGLAVLRHAKKTNPEGMVIIVTGHADLSSAIDALRLDADDYMLKPCEPDEVLFRVTRCFQKYDSQRRLRVYEDLLPVCCVCGAIRDDEGHPRGKGPWRPVEKYIELKGGRPVTSAYCPDCADDIRDRIRFEGS